MRIGSAANAVFRQLPGRLSADPLEGAALGELSVRIARLTSGPRTPHRHPRSIEVIYVVEGEGVCWQGGETHHIRAGDVVLVPQGVAHATVPTEGTELLLYCVFPTSDLAGNIEELEGELGL